MSRADEVASMGAVVDASRRVRPMLEVARDDLLARGETELAARLALVHDTLLQAESAPKEAMARALADALDGLGRTLQHLQTAVPTASWDTSAEQVALAMSLLHPLRRRLAAELDLEVEPIALAKPKRRPVLELVPEADAIPVDERRDRPRVALDVDIGLHSDTNFFTGFGDDISEGGLFVATYAPLPVGSEVTLSFVLPGGAHVTASGRVTWTREPHSLDEDVRPGMGVAFTSLDVGGAAAIQRFMERRAPIFYGD